MNAVVTGSSKGIGLAITKDLLKKGYAVWGISRTRPQEDLGQSFHFVKFELSHVDLIEGLVKELPEQVDVLVNDAGVWEFVRAADVTKRHFDFTMDINFRASVFLTIALLPRMPKGSKIVNVSSEMGIITEPKYAIYSASKAALDRFTTTLAKEQSSLMVIGVLPASVDTPGARASYHYDSDPERIPAEQISAVVMEALENKFESGSLVLVTNNAYLPHWETRDKFTVVNINK